MPEYLSRGPSRVQVDLSSSDVEILERACMDAQQLEDIRDQLNGRMSKSSRWMQFADMLACISQWKKNLR